MKKKKVILKADGNSTIGWGHIMRCLAMASMIKDEFTCIFAAGYLNPYLSNEILKNCDDIIKLPEENTHHISFLNKLNGNEIVVLDNYFFDTDYQRAIKEKGCRLICIDDLFDKHFVADVIINHAPGISPAVYSSEKHTRLCLGLEYALLRKPFLEKALKKSIPAKKEQVILCFGGSEQNILIQKCLQQLLSDKAISKIILLGTETQQKQFHRYTQDYPERFDFFYGLDADKISKLLAESSFGLFSASTIAIEAIACRLPMALGYFVDNQKKIYSGCIQNGLTFDLGNLNTFEIDNFKFSDFIEPNKINQIIKNQKDFLDGKSDIRIRDIFYALY